LQLASKDVLPVGLWLSVAGDFSLFQGWLGSMAFHLHRIPDRRYVPCQPSSYVNDRAMAQAGEVVPVVVARVVVNVVDVSRLNDQAALAAMLTQWLTATQRPVACAMLRHQGQGCGHWLAAYP
jgi:hypothetical protein